MTEQSPAPAGPPPAPPAAPARRGRTALVLLGIVALVAVLCGAARLITKITSRDPLAGRGQPVPAVSGRPSAPAPTWEPPNMLTDPHPVAEIRHGIEEWTLESAGVAKPVTSKCAAPEGFTGAAAATFACTVTYQKLTVTYQVTTKPSGSRTFTWDATAAQTVVTRAGLLTAVADRFRPEYHFTDLRCEDLPELQLVPTGTPLAQHCYVRLPNREKTAYVDLVPARGAVRITSRLQ